MDSLLDPVAEPSRTPERQSRCSISRLPPPPYLQNKGVKAEGEEASIRAEIHTEAPGSSQIATLLLHTILAKNTQRAEACDSTETMSIFSFSA